MRRPSYRPENQKPTRKIIQMIKRNCFQSVSQIDRSFITKKLLCTNDKKRKWFRGVSQIDRSFKTKKLLCTNDKNGIAFKVSLTSTVETDLRLSTLCCPVAVYKGRRFQFVLVAKKSQ